jgi:hypothetical protein
MATQRELEAITLLLDGPVDAPTHKGRTYAQWRQIVLRETETMTVLDAIDSLVQLSQPDQHDQTMATLFQVAEGIGRDFLTAFATRDAHTDLNNRWGESEADAEAILTRTRRGQSEPVKSARSYFQAGSASWRSIMKQLAQAMDLLPADAVARQLDKVVEGHDASDQLLAIDYLASRVVAEKPLAGGASWINKLASQTDSDLVRAVAMYVQLTTLKQNASQQQLHELTRNSPLVAPAVLIGMLNTNQFIAPGEMGRAAVTAVMHAVSDQDDYGIVGFLAPDLHRQSEHALGGPPPSEQETLFVRDFGKQLVLAWRDTNTAEFPGYYSLLMLAGLNLLDDETRQLADRQLVAGLEQFFATRDALTSVAELRANLGNARDRPTLLTLAYTLLYVRGELPVELRNQPLDIGSPLGSEFTEWRATRVPGNVDEDGHVWMSWYPLEASEVLLRRADMLHVELAIPVAQANVSDIELQTGLAGCLKPYVRNGTVTWIGWLGFPKYREMLEKLASESVVTSARVASLELAQRAGMEEATCQRLALELLDADLSFTDKISILRTLSRVHSLELTPETFDRLLDFAKGRVGPQDTNSEPYVNILKIMATSRVVTPQGLAILRASLGSQERSVHLPRYQYLPTQQSPDEMMLRNVVQGVGPELFQQALTTARRLGPRAAEALPTLESRLDFAEKTESRLGVTDSEVERELRAVIQAVQAKPETPPAPGDSDNPSDGTSGE